MQAPSFWQKRGLIAYLLWPLSLLYRLGGYIYRSLQSTQRVDIPVICIGNITLGGAGKTPTVIALIKLLEDAGHRPHIISRGYGGNIKNTTQVDNAIHTAAEVGDEPLMLSLHAPVWVGADRVASAKEAQQAGATITLMDDGMQNPSLHKNAILCAIDSGYGFGNGFICPAGPCRTSVKHGLSKTTAALIIGQDTQPLQTYIPESLPTFRGRITPTSQHNLSKSQWIAFAGIGRPEKFFNTLREHGADIHRTHSFADHHPYTNKNIESLIGEAQRAGASLITTRKDYMRIPETYRAHISVLDIELSIENHEALRDLLLASCKPSSYIL